MTGRYERALINIAEGGEPFDVPAMRDLVFKLGALREVVAAAADLPGIEGDAANAAREKFRAGAVTIGQQMRYLESTLDGALREANGLREAAREKLAALPAGSLSSEQEAVVRGTAVGTTLLLGPLSLLAGEGAVQAFNGYLAQQREQQAESDFTTISQAMNAMSPPEPPPATFSADPGEFTTDEDEQPGNTAPGNGGSSPRFRGGSGDHSQSGSDATPLPRTPDPVEGYPLPAPIPPHLIPAPDAPNGPGIDLDNVPPGYVLPTPDGPIHGIGTLPGYMPAPGHGGTSPSGLVGGGPSAGLGSGLAAGLIAGGGGAAALGRLAGANAANASGRAISGSGGLLGKAGVADGGGTSRGGAGASGVGGRGLNGAAGTSGAGSNGAAADGRPRSAAAAGGRSATAAGAGGRGVGGIGGGRGSRSAERDERRGLGGPIAPRLEDDAETGPRSENANAGSRDA